MIRNDQELEATQARARDCQLHAWQLRRIETNAASYGLSA